MENWDMLIGVLLVIVFVLLVQRTMSPFRCQEGEEEKNGGCVSNSTKDRWWAFWESPKCKRGELQSDYTCVASMIWDAVSPGAASSPKAATPAGTSSPNSEVLVAQMIQNIKQKFLNAPTDAPTEYRLNVGVANECPFPTNSTVMLNYSLKSAVSDADMADFRRALSDFFRTLHPNDPGLNTINTIINQMDINSYVAGTINQQSKLINLARCSNDFTANPSNPDFLPMVIFSNLITAIIRNATEGEEKIKTAQAGQKSACPAAAVMTLGADGKPNGILTGPGQTITRGTADTYVPGKVRMFAPIAIDGVGKQAGTSFHTELLNTPCEGTDIAIGDWARFDVKNPSQGEGNAVVASQQSQVVTQTAVAASCKSSGVLIGLQSSGQCCSGRREWDIGRAQYKCT
jgi:hypothetical protein